MNSVDSLNTNCPTSGMPSVNPMDTLARYEVADTLRPNTTGPTTRIATYSSMVCESGRCCSPEALGHIWSNASAMVSSRNSEVTASAPMPISVSFDA
jgi:hypothetical protein